MACHRLFVTSQYRAGKLEYSFDTDAACDRRRFAETRRGNRLARGGSLRLCSRRTVSLLVWTDLADKSPWAAGHARSAAPDLHSPPAFTHPVFRPKSGR